MSTKTFTLITNEIFICVPNINEESRCSLDVSFANHLVEY